MLRHKTITIICVSILVMMVFLSFLSEVKWWYFLALFLFWLVMTVWGSSDIRLGYFIKTYCNNQHEKERRIALTFDDGPSANTERLLKIFKKYGGKGTFFVVGNIIDNRTDIIKKMVDYENCF